MTTKELSKSNTYLPTLWEDFFKPWNEWIQPNNWMDRTATLPAVNIIENKDDYLVTLAVPGMKKEDFRINIEGNQLTISSEKEESTETNEEKFSRKEYNYTSFCRSFTMPETIAWDRIDAKYENGILNVHLPKKEEAKRVSVNKLIEVK